MTRIRSVAFGLLVYGSLILFLIAFLPVFRFASEDFAWAMTRRWGRSAMRLHRAVVGTKAVFEGLENIPAGAAIVASKHQSYWETLAFVAMLERPAFILKKELMGIPLFGRYMRRLGMIPVDRTRRGATMQSMLEGARKAAEEGRPIVIFPEGTRTKPGVVAEPRPGVYMLYAALGVPVVPAALNSGVFWPRQGGGPYRAGTIRARFMPPIPPGEERAALLTRLKADMEDAALDLLGQAYAENPAIPVPPVAAERLEARAVQSRATTSASQRSDSPSAAISLNEDRT